MEDSIHDMRACPKFDRCAASICPLDREWHTRIYRKGEPIRFYLLEYVKPDAKARFEGSMATFIYKAIEKDIENLLCRYAPLRKALERAKGTGSIMKLFRKHNAREKKKHCEPERRQAKTNSDDRTYRAA